MLFLPCRQIGCYVSIFSTKNSHWAASPAKAPSDLSPSTSCIAVYCKPNPPTTPQIFPVPLESKVPVPLRMGSLHTFAVRTVSSLRVKELPNGDAGVGRDLFQVGGGRKVVALFPSGDDGDRNPQIGCYSLEWDSPSLPPSSQARGKQSHQGQMPWMRQKGYFLPHTSHGALYIAFASATQARTCTESDRRTGGAGQNSSTMRPASGCRCGRRDH